MLRLLSDENFNGDIFRGLVRRQPDLDLVRVQDVGLGRTPDPEILEWAAREGRVLLTHDISTVPPVAHRRVGDGKPMPGVFVVPERLGIGRAIEEILFLSIEVEHDEWKDQVVYLPI
jgi:hypothetical protein